MGVVVSWIMLMVAMIVFSDGGIDFLLERGALQFEHETEVEVRISRPGQTGQLVELADLRLDPIQFFGRRQIGLIEDDEIGEGNLLQASAELSS